MLEPINGRTIFYGKSDVLTYRTYAKPLAVTPVPESSFTGCENIIFAHNITFAVTGEAFLPSFSEGDNSMVVATDSMKILFCAIPRTTLAAQRRGYCSF